MNCVLRTKIEVPEDSDAQRVLFHISQYYLISLLAFNFWYPVSALSCTNTYGIGSLLVSFPALQQDIPECLQHRREVV